MNRLNVCREVRRGLPACALTVLAGAAQAAGFQLLEQNASGLGTAYAGSAVVADDASTIYFNPAGMTQLRGRQVSLGVSAIRPSFKFSDQGSSVGALAGTGSGGDSGSWAFVPNGYLSWALDPRWTVGIGFGAPFGSKTQYDNPWVGAAQSLSFDIKTYNVNPSAAFKVDDSLAVGVGLNWQRMEAQYTRLAAVASAPLVATQVTLDAASNGWGWNVGARWTASSQTQFGVSYRSRIKHDLTGSLAVTGAAAGGSAALTSGDAKASLTLPDLFILSASHSLNDRWQLLADVSRTGWASLQQVDIVRTSGALSGVTVQTLDASFRNTWRAALGMHYRATDAMTLKAGIAYDQTPVRDAQHRLVSLPDNDRTWLSVGGRWQVAPGHRLDAGLAYLLIGKSSIDSNQTTAGRGRVVGEYAANAWIAGLQYSFGF